MPHGEEDLELASDARKEGGGGGGRLGWENGDQLSNFMLKVAKELNTLARDEMAKPRDVAVRRGTLGCVRKHPEPVMMARAILEWEMEVGDRFKASFG